MNCPFNWNQGLWKARPEDDTPQGIDLGIAGDWAPIRAFDPVIETDPAAVYGNLLPQLTALDLSVVNLEAPLSDMGEGAVKSGAVFKGNTRHVEGLSAAGFDAVTLANNHIFDFGKGAFDQTLETLNNAGIQYTGAGDNLSRAAAPLILEKEGIKIGILNFSEGEDLTAATATRPGVVGWELALMEEKIQALQGRVHCVIVIAHCGMEYVPFPPQYVGEAFRRMADAGADLVVGHHPHVPQGVEIHNGVPIYYSLGNFVFYQPVPQFYRKQGYWLSCRIGTHGLSQVEVMPYGIGDQGLFTLEGPELAAFREDFKTVSEPLWEDQGLEETWKAMRSYYEARQFRPEVEKLLATLDSDPPKGAAMFRNRVTTLQHKQLWQDTMTWIMEGKPKARDPRLEELIHQWLTREVDA